MAEKKDKALQIDIAMPCPAWKEALPSVILLCRQAALAAFREGAGGKNKAIPAELSLVLAGDSFIKPLNRKYRGKNSPTNVLSFPLKETAGKRRPLSAAPGIKAPEMLGDVVLAFETARAEAKAEGKSLADHLRHLVVHGVLHLLGCDHQTVKAARDMERLEIKALSSLGVADPYAAWSSLKKRK